VQAGDILAVRGRGWLSEHILAATNGDVSHVGMLVGAEPPIVIEALARVATRPLEVSIAGAAKAYILHDTSLTPEQRITLVNEATGQTAKDYGYVDLALQLGDALTHTRWFTTNLTHGWLDHFPICSYLVAEAYHSLGLDFGVRDVSTTPQDIFHFAKTHKQFSVLEIK